MIPRSPEAAALSAMLRRNQDARTPSILDRTPTETARERKRRLFMEAQRIAQQRSNARQV